MDIMMMKIVQKDAQFWWQSPDTSSYFKSVSTSAYGSLLSARTILCAFTDPYSRTLCFF